MDKYRYSAGSMHHDVVIDAYDAALIFGFGQYVYPRWRLGVFASHRVGDVQVIARDTLLGDARALLDELERRPEEVQYHYSVRVAPKGGRSRVERSVDCIAGGRRATVIAGPGVCALISCDEQYVDGTRADGLVRSGIMRTQEADSFRAFPGPIAFVEFLRDLRDMQPFSTDNALVLTAARKARPTKFPQLVRGIVEFIEGADAPSMTVEVVR